VQQRHDGGAVGRGEPDGSWWRGASRSGRTAVANQSFRRTDQVHPIQLDENASGSMKISGDSHSVFHGRFRTSGRSWANASCLSSLPRLDLVQLGLPLTHCAGNTFREGLWSSNVYYVTPICAGLQSQLRRQAPATEKFFSCLAHDARRQRRKKKWSILSACAASIPRIQPL